MGVCKLSFYAEKRLKCDKKDYVQWKPVYGEKIPLPVGFKPGPLAQQADAYPVSFWIRTMAFAVCSSLSGARVQKASTDYGRSYFFSGDSDFRPSLQTFHYFCCVCVTFSCLCCVSVAFVGFLWCLFVFLKFLVNEFYTKRGVIIAITRTIVMGRSWIYLWQKRFYYT